jgi:hypothetical protein
MPFIASIVSYINDYMKANCSVLTGGAFYGLSSVVARKKDSTAPLEQFPAILVDHTQYKTIEPNDKQALIIYHKLLSNTYTKERKDGYGDSYLFKCTTDLQMIVWGDSKKLGIDQELEAVIMYSMPNALDRAALMQLTFRNCLITTASSNMDRLQVFRQEYPQSQFFLKPNHQFFSIRYRVEATYDKACMDMCVANASTVTFASGYSVTLGLKFIERFQVGTPGATMAAGDTTYTNAALVGKKVFVMASNLGLPVDDGSGAIDWTGSPVRRVQKSDAGNQITFVGGVVADEIIEIYTTN